MAITGAIFNSLIYGDVNSADYGVYISGNAVFNAPQRSVELVSVPGRNGSIAIDQGHFENIEVEYPAGMFGDDKTDFRQRLSDFRNAIMSKKGYQRLSDTYHPDEYRMGMYIEGLEVEPTHYNEAGQFTLKFNCKPQRYLTSGEEEIDVTDWSDVKTLSGESVTFDDGDASKGFQSIKTVFNPSQDGTPWKSEVESAPYLFRQSSGGTVDHEYDSESDAIVGGTVAWNQLVANSGSVSVTVPSGHKYYSSIGGTKAIAISNGSAISATGGTDNIVDLTALFGSSTIADYLYSLETATAGSGVAKLKEWGFDIDSYHAYDAGSLQSVNTSAHIMRDADDNIIGNYPLDSDLTLRGIPKLDANNNLYYDGDTYLPSGSVTRKWKTVTIDGTPLSGGYSTSDGFVGYLKVDDFIKKSNYSLSIISTFNTQSYDGAIQAAQYSVSGYRDVNNSYPNNNWIYIYVDNTITTGAEFNAYFTSNPLTIVYELATPTTETADPYTAIQTVDPYGTEEYIDYGVSQGTRDIAVPVGHQTRYIKRVPINKLDKIITYVSPTSDEEDATTYETALGDSDYGGMVDVITGEFVKAWTGAVYTGQALGIAWFSDCERYQSGTVPTYGAYVVTTTMEEEQLTGQDVQILNGRNVVWTNGDAHQLYPFPEYDKFVEVTYGVEPGKIYNPTLFDAQPLIKAKGEGSIFIGDKEVEILDLDFGDVELIPKGTGSGWIPFNKTNYDLLNNGDTITIEAGSRFPIGIDTHGVPINSLTITVNHSDYQCTLWNMHAEDAPDKWWFSFTIDEPITLQKTSTAGTSLQTSFGFSVSFGSQSISAGILGEIKYNPNNNGVAGIDFSPAKEFSSEMSDISLYTPSNVAERKTVSGYSTKPVSGGDYVYIDCELGEAYIFNEGEPVLLNRYIDLGSELPVLKPGVTDITKDDTITDLIVEPHWWKI